MMGILQGTDQTMLAKLHQTHGRNKNYLMPKSQVNMCFGLNHFAGVVFYDANGMYHLCAFMSCSSISHH